MEEWMNERACDTEQIQGVISTQYGQEEMPIHSMMLLFIIRITTIIDDAWNIHNEKENEKGAIHKDYYYYY